MAPDEPLLAIPWLSTRTYADFEEDQPYLTVRVFTATAVLVARYLLLASAQNIFL